MTNARPINREHSTHAARQPVNNIRALSVAGLPVPDCSDALNLVLPVPNQIGIWVPGPMTRQEPGSHLPRPQTGKQEQPA